MAILRHIDFQVPNWGEFAAGPQVKWGYRNTVMSYLPLAYWRLGETGGTMAVDEMGTHHGTYQGGVALGQDGALMFDPNTAAMFDGSSGYMSQNGAMILNGASACSIVFWMYYNAPAVTRDGAVVSRFATTGWFVWVDMVQVYDPSRTSTLSFAADTTASWPQAGVYGPTNLVHPHQWDFYAVTFQGGTFARIYQGNGGSLQLMAENTNVVSQMGSAAQGLWLGNSYDNRRLQAVLDEMAVFDHALNEDEVRAIYNAGVGR